MQDFALQCVASLWKGKDEISNITKAFHLARRKSSDWYREFLHSAIYLFIQERFIEHQLCVRWIKE